MASVKLGTLTSGEEAVLVNTELEESSQETLENVSDIMADLNADTWVFLKIKSKNTEQLNHDYIEPEQYGAKGDGVADDTSAIQSAIDNCVAKGGGLIFFGSKTYCFTSINVKSYVTLAGSGVGSTILKQINNANHAVNVNTDAIYVTIKDMSIISNGDFSNSTNIINVDKGTGGLQWVDLYNKITKPDVNGYSQKPIVIENVLCGNSTNYGICIKTDGYVFVNNCYAGFNGTAGFYIAGSDSIYSNLYAYKNLHYGLYVVGSNNKFSNIKALFNCRDSENTTDYLLRSAFYIGGSRNTFTGCESQDNYGNGFRITGFQNIFIGCISDADGLDYSQTTAMQSSAKHFGFYLAKGSQYNIFRGCGIINYRWDKIVPYLKAIRNESGEMNGKYDFYLQGMYLELNKSDKVMNEFTYDILWTNANPTGTFEKQDIVLDQNIEYYSYYELIYYCTDNKYLSTGKLAKRQGSRIEYRGSYTTWTIRSFSISQNKISFTDCISYYGSDNDTGVSNTRLIPYQVIAYK